MIGCSAEFKALVVKSHVPKTTAEVWRHGQFIRFLDVHAGAVDADINNTIMRRFTASVSDPDGQLTPSNLSDLLSPFGTIIKLFRGVSIPIITKISVITTTQVDWTGGQRNGTIGNSNGDLVLGYN